MDAFAALEAIHLWLFGVFGGGIIALGLVEYRRHAEIESVRTRLDSMQEQITEALGVSSLVNSAIWKERTEGRINLMDSQIGTIAKSIDEASERGGFDRATIHERITKMRDEGDEKHTTTQGKLADLQSGQARIEGSISQLLERR